MSTQLQIRRIHTLKTFLCMSDEVYRKMLQSFQVCSSKNLTEAEANILISNKELEKNAVEQFDSVWMGDFCKDCKRKQFCSDPII